MLMSYAGVAGIVAVGVTVTLATTPVGEQVLYVAQEAIELPAAQIEMAFDRESPVSRGGESERAGVSAAAASDARPMPETTTLTSPAASGWPAAPTLAALAAGPLAVVPGPM